MAMDQTRAVTETAAAPKSLWAAQAAGDHLAAEAAIQRGHQALRGSTQPPARTN